MRDLIRVIEARDSTYGNTMGESVPVYCNPTQAERAGLIRRSRYKNLRGLLIGSDVYVLDSAKATHYGIAHHLEDQCRTARPDMVLGSRASWQAPRWDAGPASAMIFSVWHGLTRQRSRCPAVRFSSP